MFLKAVVALFVLALASCLTQSTSTTTSATSSGKCNGYAELCQRLFSNITFIGAHDSFAVQAGSISANQNYDVSVQLQNGIRMLQGQGHRPSDNSSTQVELCHTSCNLLDAGTVEAYLEKVATFMNDNPNEVIMILWVNSDNLPAAQWADAYVNTGLDTLSYVPTSTPMALYEWPTLQEMIDAGTRIVTFMASGADTSVVPYILDEFSMIFETPYDETNASFPCELNRPPGGSPDGMMYVINHFLDEEVYYGAEIGDVLIPYKSQLNTTNAVTGFGSLGNQAQRCGTTFGRYPNFMLVDFYDEGFPTGSVFEVAAQLNGVEYVAQPVGIATTSSTSTTTSTTTSAASLTTTTTLGASTSNSDGNDDPVSGAAGNCSNLWKWSLCSTIALVGVLIHM